MSDPAIPPHVPDAPRVTHAWSAPLPPRVRWRHGIACGRPGRTGPGAAATVLALVALFGPLPVAASRCAGQVAVHGRVVMAGWQEPVAGASVELLSEAMAVVGATALGEDGGFAFSQLKPGRYHVQARLGGASSSVAGPIVIGADAPPDPLILTIPSELYDRARACALPRADGSPTQDPGSAAAGSRGVLAGVAFDPATSVRLPAATVVAEWEVAGGRRTQAEARTDAAGRFVLCDVAADVPLTVWLTALGRIGPRQSDVRVHPGALARMDLGLEVGRPSSVRVVESSPLMRPDSLSTVLGRLLDADTDAPVPGAVVRVRGRETLTDDAGNFRFDDLQKGSYVFQVERLGYDRASQPVGVPAGASVVVELRTAPRAITLDALVVRATTAETRSARAATQAPHVVAGADMRLADLRAASVTELLSQIPSLRVQEGRFETSDGVEYGVCVQSSRALQRFVVPEQETTLPWCEMLAIVIDGVATVRGAEMLNTMGVWQIESIEFLPPMSAFRWGERAALNGALVIWSRGRGPYLDSKRGGGP